MRSISWIIISAPTKPEGGFISEFIPIKTAAKPTNECKAATNSGISVIWTLWAKKAPIIDPIIKAGNRKLTKDIFTSGPNTVAVTAINIPIIPNQIARLAFS